MKTIIKRKINLFFWIAVAAIIMIVVYTLWENYTIYSFLSSLLIHGGICMIICYLIDGIIKDK